MTFVNTTARLFTGALLSLAVSPVSAQSSGPLIRLLAQIPAESGDMVTLHDFDAARWQIASLAIGTPNLERDILPFNLLGHAPRGFELDSILTFPDGAVDTLGFSIFDIDQMAGWGDLPAASVIVTGLDGAAAAIDAALSARDFSTTEYHSQTVWHRLDDYAIDIRRNEEPFTGRNGASARFSLVGDDLLFARGWPEMRQLLDGGPSLADDGDAAAIIQSGYTFAGAGKFIGAVLFDSPPFRQPDSAVLPQLSIAEPGQKDPAKRAPPPRIELPGLPVFPRYGLLLWQDGATTTGAIVISYIRRDTAEVARDNFTALLANMKVPGIDKSFDELLPPDRRFEIIETSNRAVLVLAFTQTEEITSPLKFTTFMRTPRSRLLHMVFRRDLGLLIGRDG